MDSDLGDAFENLSVCEKSRLRLKRSLNLQALVAEGTATFEVDDEDDDEMLVDDHALDAATGTDRDSFIVTLVGKDNLTVPFVESKALKAMMNSDFMSGSFSEMAESMFSIDPHHFVKKHVIKPGEVEIKEDCSVLVHYIAFAEGADEPFDTTIFSKVPTIVDLRKPDVLPGLYLAITSMKVGEVSKFIVDSSLAFGLLGLPEKVLPNTNVLFCIEVVQVFDGVVKKSPLHMTAAERAMLPFQEILACVDGIKTEASVEYRNGKYLNAVKKYRKAICLLEDYMIFKMDDENARSSFLFTLYSNLAQCYLKLDLPSKACAACKLGLSSGLKEMKDVKLLFRLAKAKFGMKDFKGAIKACELALAMEPNNVELKSFKVQAELKLKIDEATSYRMFKGILQ